MSIAGQTVTFVSFVQGATPDSLGIKPETPDEQEVPDCLFRPLRADEAPQDVTDISTQVWRCVAPPVTAALNADGTGLLRYGDESFQIIGGAQPWRDLDGQLSHVVILAQRQTG